MRDAVPPSVSPQLTHDASYETNCLNPGFGTCCCGTKLIDAHFHFARRRRLVTRHGVDKLEQSSSPGLPRHPALPFPSRSLLRSSHCVRPTHRHPNSNRHLIQLADTPPECPERSAPTTTHYSELPMTAYVPSCRTYACIPPVHPSLESLQCEPLMVRNNDGPPRVCAG